MSIPADTWPSIVKARATRLQTVSDTVADTVADTKRHRGNRKQTTSSRRKSRSTNTSTNTMSSTSSTSWSSSVTEAKESKGVECTACTFINSTGAVFCVVCTLSLLPTRTQRDEDNHNERQVPSGVEEKKIVNPAPGKMKDEEEEGNLDVKDKRQDSDHKAVLTCQACTLMNPLDRQTCLACGQNLFPANNAPNSADNRNNHTNPPFYDSNDGIRDIRDIDFQVARARSLLQQKRDDAPSLYPDSIPALAPCSNNNGGREPINPRSNSEDGQRQRRLDLAGELINRYCRAGGVAGVAELSGTLAARVLADIPKSSKSCSSVTGVKADPLWLVFRNVQPGDWIGRHLLSDLALEDGLRRQLVLWSGKMGKANGSGDTLCHILQDLADVGISANTRSDGSGDEEGDEDVPVGDGAPVLLNAVRSGNRAAVEHLLGRGADPSLQDHRGNGLPPDDVARHLFNQAFLPFLVAFHYPESFGAESAIGEHLAQSKIRETQLFYVIASFMGAPVERLKPGT